LPAPIRPTKKKLPGIFIPGILLDSAKLSDGSYITKLVVLA
jgi:hypothetical protein